MTRFAKLRSLTKPNLGELALDTPILTFGNLLISTEIAMICIGIGESRATIVSFKSLDF